MWKARYETTTDIPAITLFRAISDINHWTEWDTGLERTRIEGTPREGGIFMLKPRGGPNVKMSIEELSPPVRFVDISHLLMAKMRTSHDFQDSGSQTSVRVTIEVWGLLGYFWRKVVGEKQIREASAQTASFLEYARTLA
ncbi:MAG: SRPBCC family protein [Gemmatimonadaceae bacterium]|nr:SRPBCC family protein [Gemmatimonadaceae bacterium]